jgi:hypothetical protein
MNDVLIVAKKKDYDVFNAMDIMQNESFLKEHAAGMAMEYIEVFLLRAWVKFR